MISSNLVLAAFARGVDPQSLDFPFAAAFGLVFAIAI
jgi:hypothetical protein